MLKVTAVLAAALLSGCASLAFDPAAHLTPEQYAAVTEDTCKGPAGRECTITVRPVVVGTDANAKCKVAIAPSRLEVEGYGRDIVWDMESKYYVSGWIFETTGVTFDRAPDFSDKGRKWTAGKYTWGDDNRNRGEYGYRVFVYNTLTRQRCDVDPTIVNKGF